MRGDDELSAGDERLSPADQPHVRGDDTPVGRRCARSFRISPTRVGTTLASVCASETRIGSAPRAWGRPFTMRPLLRPASGSAPRAWGRRLRSLTTASSSDGSAPRVWGRHVASDDHQSIMADQPHARGDDSYTPCSSTESTSDQPHVRGDDYRTCGSALGPCADQPHARGDELLAAVADFERDLGSAPCVWGRRRSAWCPD